jgi:CheY-like chemotaxis protein
MSDEMFVLISGRLGVFSGDGVQVAALDPVTTVGEMGIITRQVRAATVKAVEASNLLVVKKGPFELMLRNDVEARAQIYRNIIEILSGKIVNDNVRTRDHLLEKVKQEERNNEFRRRAEITLKILLAGSDLEREEALTQIDEALLLGGHPLKVLVVDDEPAICLFVSEALSDYDVSVAGSGAEALISAESNPPDLVITDIKMPKMDGYALLERLRESYPELPVVAISGFASADDIEEYGFDGFIEKPMQVKEFRQIVEGALSESP